MYRILHEEPPRLQNYGLLPPANEVWGKVIFSEACVKNSVHSGACMAGCVCVAGGGMHGRGACMVEGLVWQRGMHGRGHAWQEGMHGGGCVWWGAMYGRGGVHGGGHAWWGVCMAGGMCGVGDAWQGGACVAGGGGVHGRYYEIRSMSVRYASYWNAFLL